MQRKTPPAWSASNRARVLLVDDHPMVRERLSEVIGREPEFLICGEAESRHDAIKAIETCQPDLLVVDLTLKNSDGMDLIKDVHARWPKLLMLVVSMHDDSLYAERAIRAGASGYIAKQEATRDILTALRTVLRGEVFMSARSTARILERVTGMNPGNGGPEDLLTDRELQVLELTGRGYNIHRIATELHIGSKTVETYRTRIREKLNLPDASALLQAAIAWTHHR